MAVRREAWTVIRNDVCRDDGDEMHEDIDISVHLADHALKILYVPEMVSGMSARRLEDSQKDYRYYVTRFDRTYANRKIRTRLLRARRLIFMDVYYPAKLLRRVHQARTRPARPARRDLSGGGRQRLLVRPASGTRGPDRGSVGIAKDPGPQDRDLFSVEARGLEPLTPCLQSRCATNCAMPPRGFPLTVPAET